MKNTIKIKKFRQNKKTKKKRFNKKKITQKRGGLGEGFGRSSNILVSFSKDRVSIPIESNRSIEIKKDSRLCGNDGTPMWSMNIRLPNGNLLYNKDSSALKSGNAIWIPILDYPSSQLRDLLSIYENFNNELNLSSLQNSLKEYMSSNFSKALSDRNRISLNNKCN